MNDTSASAPGVSLLPDSIGAITAVHFVLMAIVAAAAIAVIIVGIRRKQQRMHAERQVEARAEDAGVVAPAPAAPAVPPPASPVAERSAPVQPAAAPPAHTAPAAPAAAVPAADREPDPSPLADEPIAAAAPMDATPASVAADIPASPAAIAPVAATPVVAGAAADGPVTQLKGLGPKLAERLASLGVTTVGQLAALNDDEATALDAQLGPFAGRMTRDRWIEQSRFLAAGDRAGFEAVFGRL